MNSNKAQVLWRRRRGHVFVEVSCFGGGAAPCTQSLDEIDFFDVTIVELNAVTRA